MEDLFLPHNISLKLKNIGFNDKCFGWYVDSFSKVEVGYYLNSNLNGDSCTAPTFEQVNIWLIKEHKLFISIICEVYKDGLNYLWQIVDLDFGHKRSSYLYGDNNEYPKYKDAILKSIEYLLNNTLKYENK